MATTTSDGQKPSRAQDQVWTIDAVRHLGVTTDIETAGAILGIGRTKGPPRPTRWPKPTSSRCVFCVSAGVTWCPSMRSSSCLALSSRLSKCRPIAFTNRLFRACPPLDRPSAARKRAMSTCCCRTRVRVRASAYRRLLSSRRHSPVREENPSGWQHVGLWRSANSVVYCGSDTDDHRVVR